MSKRDVQVVRPDYDADLNAAKPDNEQEEEPRAVANVEEAKDKD